MEYAVENIGNKFAFVDALVSKSYLTNLSSFPIKK